MRRLIVRANRFFVTMCSYWASVNREFSLPTSTWIKACDELTMVWSGLITITCVIKFFKYPERGGEYDQSDQAEHPQLAFSTRTLLSSNASDDHANAEVDLDPIDWTQVLLLNSLPRINQFSALYYGLVLITVTTALGWRVYTNFFRCPGHEVERAEKEHLRPLVGGEQADGQENQPPQYNAAIEVVHFFLEGPPKADEDQCEDCTYKAEPLLASSLEPPTLPRKGALLTRAHINEFGPKVEKCPNSVARTCFSGEPLDLRPYQIYRVPARCTDYHFDKSARRWRFLALHVYLFSLLVVICSLPLCYLTILGLDRVNERFGPQPLGRSSPAGSTDPAGRPTTVSWQDRINSCLSLYGRVEQYYAITQLVIFFIFTNVFIKLFHADLIYKVEPILAEIKSLSFLYREELIESLPMEQVRRQQLRIWSYFEQIRLIDNFLSKYSVVSLISLVAGISFGQSFAEVQDRPLKLGTFASLFSNVLSFTYLHFISEHIERKSLPIQTGLLTILASEKNSNNKREWQRILNGFFESDWKRTFTIIGKYPTNLRTYSKTATALLAACTLIHRLFHRSQWNMSFGPGPTPSTP